MSAPAAGVAGEAALLERSNLLDEVNSMLDLMVSEKLALEEKILHLEDQVKDSQTNTEKTLCKDSNAVAKGEIKELTALRKTVNLEREAIGNLRGRVERMSKDYQRERSEQKRIIDGLQTQLRHTQIHHQKEKRENKRLQEEAATRNENYREVVAENKRLVGKLEKLEEKYSRTNTSLLAMKGRVKTETRKNEEEKEKRDTEMTQIIDKMVKKRLSASLQEKDKELIKLKTTLEERQDLIRKQENQLNSLRDEVSNQLTGLEEELRLSRLELSKMKKLEKKLELKLKQSKEALQAERRQSQHLIADTETQLTKLMGVLDKERFEHQREVHSLRVAMATQKRELCMELDRLKDVSMRRVTELAKEVWELKTS